MGCGPFTQSHKLLQLTGASVTQQLVLLDPLMRQYLGQVPKCRFRNPRVTTGNFATVSDEVVLLASGGEVLMDGALVPRVRNDGQGEGHNSSESFAYHAGSFYSLAYKSVFLLPSAIDQGTGLAWARRFSSGPKSHHGHVHQESPTGSRDRRGGPPPPSLPFSPPNPDIAWFKVPCHLQELPPSGSRPRR